ncbi:hypothetical protein ACF06U_00450, partial [Streptomyces rimosus]
GRAGLLLAVVDLRPPGSVEPPRRRGAGGVFAGGPAGLPRVNDADGASAELVIDGSGRQKVIDGYLLPGRQVVGKYAFSLPPDAADKAEVEFGTDLSEADYSYWSGPLHLGS